EKGGKLIMLIFFLLYSAFELNPIPKIYSPVSRNSHFNVFLNPSIPMPDGIRASCCFTQLYSMSELNLYSASLTWTKKPYSASLFASQFGNSLYREITTGLSASYSLKNQSLGIRLKPMFLSIKNYGSKAVWSIDLFGWTEISDYLGVGLAAENILATTYGTSSNRPEINIKSHVIFSPVQEASVRIGFSKAQEIRKSFSLCLDMGSIYFVGDYTDKPGEFALGFGINVSSITPFYGISNHTDLGYTHTAFISWSRESSQHSEIEHANSLTLEPDTLKVNIFPLDVNRATSELLDRIPGIGPVLAQRIIEKRGEIGGFKDLNDLREITGIGEALFEKIKPYLFTGELNGM
ncbi:helix-hairpin-helix domain-containing protein, partial [candidate division WOR-3 bacterium]|nr:helix-hairpin-helix domain-containing protein [candidate division WOR-3 bacterium]